jgi:hypothetical protein
MATLLTAHPGVAREFRVGQTNALEKELIGPNREGREKIMGAGSGDDIVLIDAVTAHTDRTDEHAVAIKRKPTGKNRGGRGVGGVDRSWRHASKRVGRFVDRGRS